MEFKLEDAVKTLERTPATLRALLAGLPAGWLEGNEGGESWSPWVVVGHLIHGEKTDWIPRARIILEKGESRAFDPYDRFAQFRESAGKSIETLLDEFEALRRENLATLAGLKLTAGDLDKKGLHPSLGGVTLRQLVATWVVHDLGHIAQVTRVMAKQYSGEVGVWKAYLPVLTR